jgi:hypothetical protein
MREPFYIYVAGPLSDYPAQYLANVSRMTLESRLLAEAGYVPINPAADLLEGLLGVSAWPLERYQERSMDLMRLLEHVNGCVYVTSTAHADGRESTGVAGEVAEAKRLGIPVFYSRLQLDSWRRSLEGGHVDQCAGCGKVIEGKVEYTDAGGDGWEKPYHEDCWRALPGNPTREQDAAEAAS